MSTYPIPTRFHAEGVAVFPMPKAWKQIKKAGLKIKFVVFAETRLKSGGTELHFN